MAGNLQNDLCDLQYSLHGKTELKFPNFRVVVYNCIFIVVAYLIPDYILTYPMNLWSKFCP